MSDMYTERVLENYRHPQRKGLLPPGEVLAPDGAGAAQVLAAEEYNPLCGDRVTIQLHITGEQVVAARFEGRGCALCLGAASILTETVEGRSLEALRSLDHEQFLAELQSPVRPARRKCALLPWLAFRRAAFGEQEWPL